MLCVLIGPLVPACDDAGDGPAGTAPPSPQLAARYFGSQIEGTLTCTGGSLPPPPEVILTAFRTPAWLEFEARGGEYLVSGPSALGSGNMARPAPGGRFMWDDSLTTPGPANRNPSTIVRFGGAWMLQPSSDGATLVGVRTLQVQERETGTGAVVASCSRSERLELARHTTPVPDIAPVACAQEGVLRSAAASGSAIMIFRNESAVATQLFWVDTAGARVLMGPIPASGQIVINTYAAHAFMLTDAQGHCLRTYVVPSVGPTTAAYRTTRFLYGGRSHVTSQT